MANSNFTPIPPFLPHTFSEKDGISNPYKNPPAPLFFLLKYTLVNPLFPCFSNYGLLFPLFSSFTSESKYVLKEENRTYFTL